MLVSIMPLARTPQDKKGSQSMTSYAKHLDRALDNMVPWQKASSIRKRYRGKVKPGEVVVILNAGDDVNDPLFKDAKTTRE